MILPAVICGVINKGSSQSAAGILIDLFKKDGYGDGNLTDLRGVLGNSNKRDGMLEQGGHLLQVIFGDNKSGLLDMILNGTALTKGTGSSLLSFVVPIVINKLAGVFFSKNINASILATYLGDQKDEVMGIVPGLSSMLGGASSTAREGVAAAADSPHAETNGGGGLFK